MWAKIRAWFKDSETIFWARLQTLLGIIVGIGVYVFSDPNFMAAVQAAVKPEHLPFWMIGFGVLTEILRRLRADDL